MIINWYGEGCFKVQTGGLTLLTDPLESSTGLIPARGKNDIVLKTLTSWPMEESASAKASTDAKALADKSADEDGKLIRGAGEYEVQNINIRGFGLPKESTEKFFKTAYKLTAEEISLGFLGHLSDELSQEARQALQNADVLFVPAGGKPFLDQEAAAKLVKQLSPKLVVASFFKIPGLKRAGADWKNFAEEMGQKPEALEKLTIRKKEVKEQKGTKLIILKI